jgi:hypothetical protein
VESTSQRRTGMNLAPRLGTYLPETASRVGRSFFSSLQRKLECHSTDSGGRSFRDLPDGNGLFGTVGQGLYLFLLDVLDWFEGI